MLETNNRPTMTGDGLYYGDFVAGGIGFTMVYHILDVAINSYSFRQHFWHWDPVWKLVLVLTKT